MTNFGENTKSADAIAELKALMEELDLDKQLDPDLVNSLSRRSFARYRCGRLTCGGGLPRQSSGEDSPRANRT